MTDAYRSNFDSRYTGIYTLFIKIIIRAIYDWVTYRDSTKLDKLKIAEGAAKWLFEPNQLFISFENICDFVNIDQHVVRAKIKKMSKDDVAKIEYLDRFSMNQFNKSEPDEDNDELEY